MESRLIHTAQFTQQAPESLSPIPLNSRVLPRRVQGVLFLRVQMNAQKCPCCSARANAIRLVKGEPAPFKKSLASKWRQTPRVRTLGSGSVLHFPMATFLCHGSRQWLFDANNLHLRVFRRFVLARSSLRVGVLNYLNVDKHLRLLWLLPRTLRATAILHTLTPGSEGDLRDSEAGGFFVAQTRVGMHEVRQVLLCIQHRKAPKKHARWAAETGETTRPTRRPCEARRRLLSTEKEVSERSPWSR